METDRYFNLEQWYETALGRYVYAAETDLLSEHLQSSFGYYLVQLGGLHALQALKASVIRHHICCTSSMESGTEDLSLRCDFSQLPFGDNSIDSFVLPHTLELSRDPEKIIAEVGRALIPEGTLFILGFNPAGIFSAEKIIRSALRPCLPWDLPWRRIGLLRRWLQSNECELESIKTFLFSLSPSILASLKRRRFLEALGQSACPSWGGVYLLTARKRILGLTPLKMQWKKAPIFNKAPILPMQNKR